MNEMHDGGQVAPRMKMTRGMGQLSAAAGTVYEPEGGLSLLDYFAGLALQNRLDVIGRLSKDVGLEWDEVCSHAAKGAYDVAEAMLKEREARK